MQSKRNNFIKKAAIVITLYFILLLIRKTILSFDVRILHWLMTDIKFADYQSRVKGGILSIGDINYNLTKMKLSSVTIERSNVDISNLWEFKRSPARYVNIAFQSGNANFYANWAYSVWPSLAHHGNLTLHINNASLVFGVKISTNQSGFINMTSSECVVKIGEVNLEFDHEPNMMFESVEHRLKNKAVTSLPERLCKALRNGLLKPVHSMIHSIQNKFVKIILLGDVKGFQNSIGVLAWILVYAFFVAFKVIHDYGVTLLVVLIILGTYFIYELVKLSIGLCRSVLSRCRRGKVRSRSDPEPYPEQEKPVLTPVSVTIISRSKEGGQKWEAFFKKFKKFFWWRKTKLT